MLIMTTASHSFRQKLSNIISVICDCSQEYNKCELSQLSPFSLSSLVVVYYKTFHNKQSQNHRNKNNQRQRRISGSCLIKCRNFSTTLQWLTKLFFKEDAYMQMLHKQPQNNHRKNAFYGSRQSAVGFIKPFKARLRVLQMLTTHKKYSKQT